MADDGISKLRGSKDEFIHLLDKILVRARNLSFFFVFALRKRSECIAGTSTLSYS